MRTSRRKQLRKSNCRSTGGGVRARGGPGTVTGPAVPPREEGAWERVPRLAGQSPANWSLPHGGERHKGADRRSPTKDPANLQGLKPDLGLHVPRPRDGRSRGSNDTTSKKTTLSEPPTRSRTEVLGLDWTSSKGSRTADGRRRTALVQAAVSGSGESTGPTSAGGTRRQPNAEAGTDDGGDDTRYVTGPWMQHQC